MKHFKTDWNPITGARHDYYWDAVEEKLVVRNRHEVGSILEANKRQANQTIDQRFGKEMLHHVADIPMGVVAKWKAELGVDVFSNDPWHKKRVKQLLNDPENRYLKTTVKRI